MIMKTFLKLNLLLMLFVLVSCNDSFLDRAPRHLVTSENFFNNTEDLKTFTNGFYSYLNFEFGDGLCDNVSINSVSTDLSEMLYGSLSPATVDVAVWDWSQIRNVNYFLANAGRAIGEDIEKNHYIGLGRLMRAYLYYQKVKLFGDVPWYDRPLLDTDEAELYKTQDSRNFVITKIMEDLDFAVKNMINQTNRTVYSKWVALALQARIALHEGTFRKYHGLEGGDEFLKIAENASTRIMKEGGFTLHPDYTGLFNSKELKVNPEMILFREHTLALSKFTVHYVLDLNWGLSRDLIDSYLMKDGTPFSQIKGWETMTINEQFANRDARLIQTCLNPGWIDVKLNTPYKTKPAYGGYGQIKFYPSTAEQCYYYACESDIPIIRYAEILLINAEAKAELGTLTDTDLTNTINLLRERGNISKKLTIDDTNANFDKVESNRYPNVSGANTGVILEIRRERRVELACEGFRYDDLMRWKAGELLAKPGEGMYVPGFGAYDVTGDGKVDIAILKSLNETGPIADLPDDIKATLEYTYVDGSNFYLENGTSGRIRFNQDRDNSRVWSDKYYFRPIPEGQIVLNPNLKQPGSWK